MNTNGTGESLSLAQFQDSLRHVARYDTAPAVADPLGAAVSLIEKDPSLPPARLMRRLMRALIDEDGTFRRAELATFDAYGLRIGIALLNAARAGTGTRDWAAAILAADTAAGNG